jgi:hypothetical protein
MTVGRDDAYARRCGPHVTADFVDWIPHAVGALTDFDAYALIQLGLRAILQRAFSAGGPQYWRTTLVS